MGESAAIERAAAGRGPATAATLAEDLRALGVREGSVVMAHASLSALGFVVGGAEAVVDALRSAVGPTGTIVVPTHSGQLSDPAGWENPPVPADWIRTIRDHLPAFDPARTATRSMGAVPEALLRLPDSVRSAHPHVSIAASGPHAFAIIEPHDLAPAMGVGSPLSRLVDLEVDVVLLGVGHANNTLLHLCEYLAEWPAKPTKTFGAPVVHDGERRWVTWDDLDVDADDFDRLGAALEAEHAEAVSIGPVGSGTGRRVAGRDLVAFATQWLSVNR